MLLEKIRGIGIVLFWKDRTNKQAVEKLDGDELYITTFINVNFKIYSVLFRHFTCMSLGPNDLEAW